MRRARRRLSQSRDQPRLSDSGFPGDQNGLTLAGPNGSPALRQNAQFVDPSHEGR